MKKISAILLALIMMLSMVASAATITITAPTLSAGEKESGITYTAYKVFDAVISDSGNYAYTIDSSSKYFDTVSAYSNLNTAADKTLPEYFELTQVNDSTTYIVKATSAYTNDTAAEFVKVLETVTGVTAAGTAAANADKTEYTFENLAEGYYLITSSVGSVLALDTTVISDTDKIAAKNDYPDVDKFVRETLKNTTADMGVATPFTIKVEIPSTAVGAIVVHDDMTNLVYVEMTDYTDKGVANKGTITATEDTGDDCEVHFTLDAAYVAAHKSTTTTPAVVEIDYTAYMTAATAENDAYIVDDTFTSSTVTTTLSNTDIPVYKYTLNAGNKVGLDGAEFVLKNANGKFYKYTAASAAVVDDPDTEADETKAATDALVEWVDTVDAATKVAPTASNSYVDEFVGLADGTYVIVEVTVPDGYNAAQNTTVVIADSKITTVDNKAFDGTNVEILNSTGSELPSTGGIGTTIFYTVGGLMMAAAIVLLVAKKKVAASK